MAATFVATVVTTGVDAVKALFNSGTVRIYGGTVPADVDASLGAATLLAEMTLANPAFGASTSSGNDIVCSIPAPISDSSANATGTATFFSLLNSSAAVLAQGTAGGGGSGSDMLLTQPALVSGGPVEITTITLRQARK